MMMFFSLVKVWALNGILTGKGVYEYELWPADENSLLMVAQVFRHIHGAWIFELFAALS